MDRKSSKASKAAALAALKAAREGGVSGLATLADQAEEDIYEEVDEEEYRRLVEDRRSGFIVDDNGLGYADDGMDDWGEEDMEGEDGEEGAGASGSRKKQWSDRDVGQSTLTSVLAKHTLTMRAVGPSAGTKRKATAAVEDMTDAGELDALLAEAGVEDELALKEKASAAHKRARARANAANPFALAASEAASQAATQDPGSQAGAVAASASASAAALPSAEAVISSVDQLTQARAPGAMTAAERKALRLAEKKARAAAEARVAGEAADGSSAAAAAVKGYSAPTAEALGAGWDDMLGNATAALAQGVTPGSGLGKPGATPDVALFTVDPAEHPGGLVGTPKLSSATGKPLHGEQIPARMLMYWLDAYEDYHNPGTIYLFGKVPLGEAGNELIQKALHNEQSESLQHELANLDIEYASICVRVQNVQRCCFVQPRSTHAETGEPVNDAMLREELSEVIAKNVKPASTAFRFKMVERDYAFELAGVPREKSQYGKLVYSARSDALPANISGKTFARIFGTQTSCMEHFILKRGLMGPCWLELRGPRITHENFSWCKVEVDMLNPKHVLCISNGALPSPPLVVASLSLKTVVNPSTHIHEIVVASLVLHDKVNLDGSTLDPRPTRHVSLVRPPPGHHYPADWKAAVSKLPQARQDALKSLQTESILLRALIAQLAALDPDVLLGHNISGFDLDVLMNRMRVTKLPSWSRIGRIRRSVMPKATTGAGGREKFMGNITAGRMLVDTYSTARELVRETSYALSQLVRGRLGVSRVDVDPAHVPGYFGKDAAGVMNLVHHTERDASLALGLAFNLEVISLTKQITNLAGNLWSRTLKGARAERIEYLLLHEFHRRKYIMPDKLGHGSSGAMAGVSGVAARNAKKREKPKYSGGLVLEPKRGLYDSYVLLLDFNSLYPSIIQEYNICFTTVDRPLVSDADAEASAAAGNPDDEDDEHELEEVTDGSALPPLPEPAASVDKLAPLPHVIRYLVRTRGIVKQLIKKEKDPAKRSALDVRQLAFKILANSMYGCLGFKHSRFYAQPIAALVTATGRDILQKTVDVARDSLNCDVIYGDTDSIMVNSGSRDLATVKKLGAAIMREVNQRYKALEIDIDGVYAMMLLLKKKKYAALMAIEDPEAEGGVRYKKEVKGLDMVRRDWCVLSKRLGQQVLSRILSRDADLDVVAANVREVLDQVSTKARAGELPLEDWVITKGLNKAPKDYPDASSQPHLQVALRLIAEGKPVNVGDHVPYVICKDDSKPSGTATPAKKSIAARARHPDEVRRSNGALVPDVDWYLTQQILPPISRLCEPIQGLGMQTLAECLGLDPTRFRSYGGGGYLPETEEWVPTSTLDDGERFKAAEPLLVSCSRCGRVRPFPGLLYTAATCSDPAARGPGELGLQCADRTCGGWWTAPPAAAIAAWHDRAAEIRAQAASAGAPFNPWDVVIFTEAKVMGLQRRPEGAPPVLSANEAQIAACGLMTAVRTAAWETAAAASSGLAECDGGMCDVRTYTTSVADQGKRCPNASCHGSLRLVVPPHIAALQLEYLSALFSEDHMLRAVNADVEEGGPKVTKMALAADLKKLPESLGQLPARVQTELAQFLDVCAQRFVDSSQVFSYVSGVSQRTTANAAHADEEKSAFDGTRDPARDRIALAHLVAAAGTPAIGQGSASTKPLLAMTL